MSLEVQKERERQNYKPGDKGDKGSEEPSRQIRKSFKDLLKKSEREIEESEQHAKRKKKSGE
ncbi:MAG: hypothetical protein COV29_02325 [Candidatus Yanofskybacteria bacterium CG10_big_fil_rev_8_21_14_0_10_36_16]|uniref:Uncharacterized protein n=1 Tax=Candidatus Yanofskybacteria bacterium CG10_big_fil_rev_8_21_14_0_10_36_16 TaxID=1975096 RepID=A0A2J0Q7M7_9BACT|nr:MAG: hypothetical protein COV29_02325 [Candidatus Yanofskybacteria bacterium CG10_big_fil_rev_8_21_14_0_10_36_16]